MEEDQWDTSGRKDLFFHNKEDLFAGLGCAAEVECLLWIACSFSSEAKQLKRGGG